MPRVENPDKTQRPYLQFFWRDWLGDTALRTCSAAARGVWIDLICIMAQGSPFGTLRYGDPNEAHRDNPGDIPRVIPRDNPTLNPRVIQGGTGKPIPTPKLARILGLSESELALHLDELEDAGVFSRDSSGTIFCRRMVRDEERRKLLQAAAKRGGNPALTRRREVQEKQSIQTLKKGVDNPGDNPEDIPRVNPRDNPGDNPRDIPHNPYSIDPYSREEKKEESISTGLKSPGRGVDADTSSETTQQPLSPKAAAARGRILAAIQGRTEETYLPDLLRSGKVSKERVRLLPDCIDRVLVVFDAWRDDTWFCERPNAARLSPERLAKLIDRCQDSSLEELLATLEGVKLDDHYQRNAQYRVIETIFRDRGQVERFGLLRSKGAGQQKPPARTWGAPDPSRKLQAGSNATKGVQTWASADDLKDLVGDEEEPSC